MPISMDPAVRYVTQQSVYSLPITGQLTNRRIAKYEKMGYYSNGVRPHSANVVAKKKKTFKQLKAELLKTL